MNLLALTGAALPIAAAYLLLQPARRAGVPRLFTVALAVGLGLGISSCAFFLALVFFDGRRAGVIGIDAILAAAALAAWLSSGADRSTRPAPFSPSERVLGLALLFAALAGATGFLANTFELPHGQWDAWATWNVRARWLADAGPAWRLAVAKPAIHGDYPLLLPATIARLWVYGSTNDPIVPAVIAAAYGAALVLLLYAALAALGGRTRALVGALCLLGTPVFLRVVAWQYADVPLAFNLLAVVAALCLGDRDPEEGRWMLVWAGIATGLLLWTKNEGMMLALAIIAVRAVWMIVRREWSNGAPRSAARFAAGLLPPAAIVLYFKLALAPPNPEFGSMIEKILELERYRAVLRAAAYEIARGTGPVLLALLVYAILLGRTSDRRARGVALSVLSVVAFGGLGYGFAYVTARSDLNWLLSHSMDRLVLQLWPTFLFGALLYVASPPEREARLQPFTAPRSRGPSPSRGSSGSDRGSRSGARRRERAPRPPTS